jgi:phage gp29-like protein
MKMAETEKKAPPISEEIAVISKDVDVTAGFFLENPDTTILTESKGKGLKLYDEIDRDAHSGSVLQTRYLSVAGERWEVTPADESARSKEIAALVTTALEDCNMIQAVQELMQGILYGFYVAEVMWEEKDKVITPARILAKHPRRFGFTVDRQLRLLTKAQPKEGEVVPECKFMVFSYGDSDNPFGKGLGRRLWWPLWFKKHGIKFWLIFLDKFGMPTGIGEYPSNAKEDEKKTLLEAVNAIHSETGVIIPEGMVIKLLEASRSGNVTYESLCEYMDLQISKAVLGQTLTTEVKGGSLAASQTHEEVRDDIKVADAGLMSECLNETLVKWIVDFNFSDVKVYPKFSYNTEKEQVLKDRAERDEVLVARIGVQVDDDYWYDTYNLPRPKGGAKVVTPQAQQGFMPQFAETAGTAGKTRTIAQRMLDDHAAKLAAGADLSANEARILEAVRQSTSFEEAFENVLALYPDMDMTSLQDSVETAIINGNLLGRMAATAGANDDD